MGHFVGQNAERKALAGSWPCRSDKWTHLCSDKWTRPLPVVFLSKEHTGSGLRRQERLGVWVSLSEHGWVNSGERHRSWRACFDDGTSGATLEWQNV